MSTLQIDTSVDASDPPLLGGRITLPCFTNEEQEAQILNISRHDVAGLACLEYHGGTGGVKELTISFIHTCGYQTFPTDNADDILPCYGHIQLLHKKVH